MYICLCNALTENQVRSVVRSGLARRAGEVHRACGCSTKCGVCLKTMLRLVDQMRRAQRVKLMEEEAA